MTLKAGDHWLKDHNQKVTKPKPSLVEEGVLQYTTCTWVWSGLIFITSLEKGANTILMKFWEHSELGNVMNKMGKKKKCWNKHSFKWNKK